MKIYSDKVGDGYRYYIAQEYIRKDKSRIIIPVSGYYNSVEELNKYWKATKKK